jgi:hypothetical protein
VGQMLLQVWGLCGKIICTRAVLLIIRVYIIWINLRNERTCYLIYWTALVVTNIKNGDFMKWASKYVTWLNLNTQLYGTEYSMSSW